MRIGIAAVLAGIAFSQAASALDIASFDTQRREPATSTVGKLLSLYLLGVGEGFKWANASLIQRKESPLFCAPPILGLTAANYLIVIDRELELRRDSYARTDIPIEFILLYGLQQQLPCPPQ